MNHGDASLTRVGYSKRVYARIVGSRARALVPPQWTSLGRTTKISPIRNRKGRSILEFIKHHNPCPKELVHVADWLAEHEKNNVSKNAKISSNTISLFTPKGVHNYTATLTTKRSYFNNYITQQGQKRLESKA